MSDLSSPPCISPAQFGPPRVKPPKVQRKHCSQCGKRTLEGRCWSCIMLDRQAGGHTDYGFGGKRETPYRE